MRPHRAVFLDKDGTLVEDVPYNADPDRLRLTPGAGAALAALAAAGYRLVVVSNQSGVARGLFAEDSLPALHRRLQELLAVHGVCLDGFYWCPHYPRGKVAAYATACDCRKPAPGLLLRAAKELGVDLAGAWMVGDILDDVEAGRRAGCRTILLDNGHETEWLPGPERCPHHVAADLPAAADIILGAGDPQTGEVPIVTGALP
jgi:histidinol-phosphate phosphatase family protein